MEILESEVLRYLGYRGAPPDETVIRQIEEAKTELEACITPRNVYGKWACRVDPVGISRIGDIIIESKALAACIKDCEQAVLFAATLGTEADTLIRRYSVTDIGKAAILQAASATMLESYCDDLERQIMDESALDGLYTTPRFSPGYGDFSIAHQKDILNLLDCGRWIGLTMANSFMLIPTKSVSALIGLSRAKNHHMKKCEDCVNLQCKFRKG